MTIPLNTLNTSAPSSTPLYTPSCGSLQTASMWIAMFYIIAVFVAFLIPLQIFFYEASDDKRSFQSRFCEALQYQGVALIVVGIALGIMYWQINSFSYPVSSYPVTQSDATTCSNDCIGPFFNPNTSTLTVEMVPLANPSVSQKISSVPNLFGVYLASFTSFIGWFLFCMYTGIGLVSLPIDLVKSFLYRPRYIPKETYLRLREEYRNRVNELYGLGEKMQKDRKKYDEKYSGMGYYSRYQQNSAQRTFLLEFKKQVAQVEADLEDLRVCHEAWTSYNPLIPYVKLFLGFVSACLSICWVLQVVLYILPQYRPTGASIVPTYFLNTLITWGLLYSGFALIGVIFIALFGLYLFICNLDGNFRVGLKFLIIEIHPMKFGETYMNSFLVNVLLLLLQTPALLNFLALSFSNTVVLTDIDTIMNVSVYYTVFFIYFFQNNVFIWLLLAFVVLAACLIYALPDDRKKNQKRLKNKVDKMESDLLQKEKNARFRPKVNLSSITAKAKNGDGETGGNEEEGALGRA